MDHDTIGAKAEKPGTAVVTGASSGIGKVYADRLARRGYDLILIARRADRLDALAKDLRERYGVMATALVADLSDGVDLDRVIELLRKDPSLTLLVNNAGTSAAGVLSQAKDEATQTLINLNVTALTRLTTAVLPGLLRRNRGAIINIGSVVGFKAYRNNTIYSATKSYVMTFTRGLQKELTGTRVTAQLVAPSATESEIWDIMGFPLSNIHPAIVMTAEDCVDASLRGLDMGEQTTLPSVENPELLANYDTAAAELFKAAQQTGKPASRYGIRD